jgi:hypothetical protein
VRDREVAIGDVRVIDTVDRDRDGVKAALERVREHHDGRCVALVLAAAIGTGAFTPVPVADGVTVESSPGPNGEYASASESVDLRIAITDKGVSPDTTTYIDDVLVVTNGRDTTTRFRIEDGAEEVRFYDSADREFVSSAADRATLDPGEQLSVGMVVDATDVASETIVLEQISILSGVQTPHRPNRPGRR